MDVVLERCAALDIAKASVAVCLRLPHQQQTRTFGTMTGDLIEMGDWLLEHGVTHVAMESTSSYWKPIYNLLEGYEFELVLVNPHEFKAVPGRKTDVKDAEWLADLLRHGLLKASFVPERAQRELRELVRYRKALIQERTRELNRIEKVLEGANIKLSTVASTMTGKSVREMLRGLLEGKTDPVGLAERARGRMRAKRETLVRALTGTIGSHQRFMLGEQLAHLEELEQRIGRVSREVEQRLGPFEEVLRQLETIPGVGRRVAEVVLSEIGLDMSRFPSAGHLASWAKLSPGNHESAGKRKSGRTGHGSKHLRTALVEAAQAASRRRGTYLSAQYHRLAGRRGKKRAAVAVAHSMLVIIYHLLRDGGEYRELGGSYFDALKEERVVRRLEKRLKSLGYEVVLEKRAA